MIQKFSDREYAVMYDSLAQTRDRIREMGHETPTIDSALTKLGAWATPSGCEFLAVTGEDATLIAAATA